MKVESVILLLGSNMGNRLGELTKADDEIGKAIGKIIRRSKIYETASWGNETLTPFLNQVVEAETALLPQEIMQRILKIEESMGRRRTAKWASRKIDIDILFYADKIMQSERLHVPHPGICEREFVLRPFVE